jgi:hypothetical protein
MSRVGLTGRPARLNIALAIDYGSWIRDGEAGSRGGDVRGERLPVSGRRRRAFVADAGEFNFGFSAIGVEPLKRPGAARGRPRDCGR